MFDTCQSLQLHLYRTVSSSSSLARSFSAPVPAGLQFGTGNPPQASTSLQTLSHRRNNFTEKQGLSNPEPRNRELIDSNPVCRIVLECAYVHTCIANTVLRSSFPGIRSFKRRLSSPRPATTRTPRTRSWALASCNSIPPTSSPARHPGPRQHSPRAA